MLSKSFFLALFQFRPKHNPASQILSHKKTQQIPDQRQILKTVKPNSQVTKTSTAPSDPMTRRT